MKHTKGPWNYSKKLNGTSIIIDNKNQWFIETVSPLKPQDAALITAAPELLEALEKVCSEPECPDHIAAYLLPILSKAKGGE